MQRASRKRVKKGEKRSVEPDAIPGSTNDEIKARKDSKLEVEKTQLKPEEVISHSCTEKVDEFKGDQSIEKREERNEKEKVKRLEFLTFILGDEEYAIDVMVIKEIIRAVELTYIPKTPQYIKGIISLRGVVIPIFDLKDRLRLKRDDMSTREEAGKEEGYYVIIGIDEKLVGIIVDLVREVVEIEETRIEPPPEIIGEVERSHLRGVTRYKGRLLILIDLEKVLGIGDEDDS